MSTPTARIGIDCRLAGQRHAGIGRYTENLVREVLRAKHSFHWVLFFSDQEQADQVLGDVSQHHSPYSIVLTGSIRHYSLAEQLQLPKIFADQELDLLHVPHFNIPIMYRGKLVVTIHDLLWHEYRGAAVTTLSKWKYWPKYLMYRLTVWCAVRQAELILTPSQTVAAQVQKYFPSVKRKIVVTLEGVEERFFSGKKTSTQHQPKTLLYLGSLYPHKNVKVVLQALTLLPEYTLLVVGARSVFQDQLIAAAKTLHVAKQLNLLGHLSDEDVTELLHTSTALVQPSLSEGFGLTGLEAMAAGCPVLASDIPIFREIYQDQAVFFDPHSPEAFVAALQKIEHNDRSATGPAAQAFASQYSWKKMAEQTLTAYDKVLSQSQ